MAGKIRLANNVSGQTTLQPGASANVTVDLPTTGGTLVVDPITSSADITVQGLTLGLGNSSVSTNTVFGKNTGSSITTGGLNTAVGFEALKDADAGERNSAVGHKAFFDGTTGSNNTAIGCEALLACTSGANNVALGDKALSNLGTGAGNTAIGSKTNSGTLAPVFNVTTEDNRFVLGHTSITNLYAQVSLTVVSDERDKTNFGPVPYGLDFVNQLKPTAYQFKTSRESEEANGTVRYGFKAQDILALEGNNPVIIDAEDENHLKYKGEHLVPVLVNAVQELTKIVKELEIKIQTLKS